MYFLNSFVSRMGLAVPVGHAHITVQKPPLKVDYLNTLRTLPGLLLAPWKYCSHVVDNIDSQELVEELLSSLSGKDFNCRFNTDTNLLTPALELMMTSSPNQVIQACYVIYSWT